MDMEETVLWDFRLLDFISSGKPELTAKSLKCQIYILIIYMYTIVFICITVLILQLRPKYYNIIVSDPKANHLHV